MMTDELSVAHQVARSMTLTQAQVRNGVLFVLSVLAVFVLQPAMPIRQMDFWLPFASLTLTVLVWAVTRATSAAPVASSSFEPQTLIDTGLIAAVVLVVALLRYVEPLSALITRSRPPEVMSVLVALAVVGALTFIAARFGARRLVWTVLVVMLVGLLVVLKFDPLTQAFSRLLRTAQTQNPQIASALDVRWLGLSYIAFRLIHALRERATGKLPKVTLREFMTYVVFFPALTAGPIDRVERFIKDLRAPFVFNLADATEAARRLAFGLFKKYVVADQLALVALNDVNARQVHDLGWAWLLVYAFAFRIFFDFAGYSDIAIAIARFFGIKLPENFRNPYLKPNLTQFWNNWHITLSQWFRAYWFNPLTRGLRQRNVALAAIIFVAQLTTMVLIGLWHGITLNFVAWGLWHGLGLFIHNRWSEFAKASLTIAPGHLWLQRAVNGVGTLITFHFVALGWVFFALPSLGLSLRVFRTLIGLG